MPLTYKDSYLLSQDKNTLVNAYIKHAEYAMSVVKFISGLLCLTLEKHNFSHFDDHYKVPIYTIIGSSLAFLFIYALFDAIEISKSVIHTGLLARNSATHTPAILTNLLYLTMLCMSCVVGGGLGIVYGIADIEGLFTESLRTVYLETFTEIMSLAPVGVLIGAAFWFSFGVLRAFELIWRGPIDVVAKEKSDSEFSGASSTLTTSRGAGGAAEAQPTLRYDSGTDSEDEDDESKGILI